MGSGAKDCEVDGESGVRRMRVLSPSSPSVLAPPPGVGTPAVRAWAPARRHPQEKVFPRLEGERGEGVGPRSFGKVALGSLTPPCSCGGEEEKKWVTDVVLVLDQERQLLQYGNDHNRSLVSP